MTHPLTPTQTVGPFFHDALLRTDAYVTPTISGASVHIVGAVYDGAGNVVPDAVIEAWEGHCFTRTGTESGSFAFTTRRPLPGHDARPFDAPHIDIVLFARGVLNQLVTRIYFDDEPSNETDPVLALVPDARRSTLIARREHDSSGSLDSTYRFDIVLQGGHETVFFDVR